MPILTASYSLTLFEHLSLSLSLSLSHSLSHSLSYSLTHSPLHPPTHTLFLSLSYSLSIPQTQSLLPPSVNLFSPSNLQTFPMYSPRRTDPSILPGTAHRHHYQGYLSLNKMMKKKRMQWTVSQYLQETVQLHG